jgi:hypothetical protein
VKPSLLGKASVRAGKDANVAMMIKRGAYQSELDRFYSLGPFRLIDVERKKQGQKCECCGNQHLKRLCLIIDKKGSTWRIGFDCWSNIDERQFSDPACSLK